MKDLDAAICSERQRTLVNDAVKSFTHYLVEALEKQPSVRRAEPTQHTLATARLDAELMRQLLESRTK